MGLTKRQMSIDGVVQISSNAYTTINQGGGDKKAGLIPTKNVNHWRWIAMAGAQTRNTLPNQYKIHVINVNYTYYT